MAYIPTPQKSWQITVTTGFTQTIPDGITIAIFNSAIALLAGTIILPANPLDGQPLTIISQKGIIAAVVQANTGQTQAGPAISAAGVYVPIRLKYSGINDTWYPN